MMKKLVFLISLIVFTIPIYSQNTLTYLEIKVINGNVGANFSLYCGQDTIDSKGSHITTGKLCLKKLYTRENDTRRIYAGESWIVQDENIGGKGIYVLDLSGWDNASADVNLVVNGKLMFKGSGNCDNFKCWSNCIYGDKVKQINNLQIAIDLN